MAVGGSRVALREIGRLFGPGGASSSDDQRLLQRFTVDRDEVAFETLIDRHGPMVLAVCRKIVGDPADAEDAFQATFLVLVRKAGTIRVDGSLGPWLYTVARRVALRAGAESVRRRAVEASVGARVETAEAVDLDRSIHDELGRLPETYRAAVVLCYLEGLSHPEAARRLGWPVGTVKGRLARAKDLLRSRLARRGVGLSVGTIAAGLRPASVSATLAERAASAASGFLATRGAAGSVSAAALAKGVIATMTLTQLKSAAVLAVALGIGAGIAGVGLARPGGQPGEAAQEPANGRAEVEVPPESSARDSLKEIDARVKESFKAYVAELDLVRRREAVLGRIAALDADRAELFDEMARLPRSSPVDDQHPEELEREVRSLTDEAARHRAKADEYLARAAAARESFRRWTSAARTEDPTAAPSGTSPAKRRPFATEADKAGRPTRPVGPVPPATEGSKRSLPEYRVEPPDLLTIEVPKAPAERPIRGEHLVRPDGAINLGFYGEVYVAGLNTTEVREKLAAHLAPILGEEAVGLAVKEGDKVVKVAPRDAHAISVDVSAYNSKVYYVQGSVESPGRFPVTGNETVLDAINHAGGLAVVSADQVQIRLIRPDDAARGGVRLDRSGEKGRPARVLTIDLDAIVQRGDTTTNYQLLPGDRLVVAKLPDLPRTTETASPDAIRRLESRLDAMAGDIRALREALKK